MNKEYRAHPLMILSFIRPFLFALVIPLVSALIRYLTDRKPNNILAFELLILAGITLIGVARYYSFKLIISENMLTIKIGIIFVRTSRISLSKLSSVQSEYTPLDLIFRSVTYSINTEAGSLKKSDFKFKLWRKDGTEISEYLYADKTVSRIKFSAIKVAVMAAATSSAATGMVIGVPVIRRVGKLLGIGLEEMLFDEINTVSNKFQTYFPPIVNTVTLVFLLGYAVSFVYSFIKHVNFKLSFGEESLVVHSGFFVRFKTAFKRSRVNNVKIEQTLLMRLIRRFSLKVSVGGFDDAKSVSQVVVPSGKKADILSDFGEYFPFLVSDGRTLHPKRTPRIRNRIFMWPLIYLLINLAISTPLILAFPEFDRLIQFLNLVVFVVLLCLTASLVYEYRHGKLKISDNIFAQSNRFFGTRAFYSPKKNIGQIKITRFRFDRDNGICRVRFTVCSENADSIRVRFLDHAQVTADLANSFNLGDYFDTHE